LIEVTIEKLIYGGRGLGRHEGLAVFVPGVLPGEKVTVEIRKRRKGFAEAQLIEIIEPSPDRIAPPCNGEEECTGAHWPFISYPAQLRFKEQILLEVLRKIGNIEPRTFLPIIPSPETERYRLRVQFNVRYAGSRPMIGFFREGTHRLVEIRNGFLLHPVINRILDALRGVSHLLPPMKEIHVNASPEGEALLLFFMEKEGPPSLAPLFDALRKEAREVIGVIGCAVREKREALGRNYITLRLDDISFRSTEGNFFQVNWSQNRNMAKSVLDLAELRGGEHVLDLCCGIGNFTLPLARRAGKVIGIESVQSSIDDARINAEENGIRNVEFMCDTVRRGLKWLLQRKERADVIVLDPPRAGMVKRAMERVIEFSPKKVIYISCNPTTLARDLAMLREGGYSLHRLQPIDMFPYTHHIETIAEMVKE
jgi:23S rRNA (uracil1939-C5)-methyltransferase